MMSHSQVSASSYCRTLIPLAAEDLAAWVETQADLVKQWITETGFSALPGTVCLLPDSTGKITTVLYGVDWHKTTDPWHFAALPHAVPAGVYRFAEERLCEEAATRAAVAWALATYHDARYKTRFQPAAVPVLEWPQKADRAYAQSLVKAVCLGRDLINTPAEDLGPEQLAVAVRSALQPLGAEVTEIIGDDLLAQNYPLIHAVGRAANHATSRAPRLIDVRWGPKTAPRLTLVGKGVCFDTGGLDIKISGYMKLMKKDMGGAAHMVALAQMIMENRLPVCLRLLIPAVENSVAGNAFRPLDIIQSRNGMTVEIGNTDAEGRLVLADALAEAVQEKPDLLIDCATLTGAARVALGPELPALFSNNDTLAQDIMHESNIQGDPVWPMPLWLGYRSLLDSKIADINNAASAAHAGAITAALFLHEFARECPNWVHLDLTAWNFSSRPGRPEGGEIMALRTLYWFIKKRFST